MSIVAIPRTRHLAGLSAHGFHRIAYREWGDADNPRVTICVHGLARNGRDFDALAQALMPTHRVLAVDMPGRGESEWLLDAGDYAFPTYLTTLTALIARSGAQQVDFVGTSMGGLLGIVLAAQPGSPVSRLIVNDVGPTIDPAGLQRIGSYVGLNPVFETYGEIETYVRTISAPFGALTDAQWTHLTRSNVRQRADGRWVLAYDPKIAVPLGRASSPTDLWPLWDAIQCPTLVLRGAQSDLFSHATAQAMAARGPRPRVVEFAGVGHAPMLQSHEQIQPVVEFLTGKE
ncbi:MAG: alpha/beta fold hydrolase [Casimicrobiaceae bacterium]